MVSEQGVAINFYLAGKTQTECRGENFVFTQQTDYPFDLSTKITIDQAPCSKMNLRLRIPHWATSYRISINGAKFIEQSNSEAHYAEISRKFRSGDTIDLSLTTKPRFEATHEGVLVSYGALIYAYPIDYIVEKSTFDSGGKCSEEFPAYYLLPLKPLSWAYAIDTTQPIEVVDRKGGNYPWDEKASPIELKVKARAVKNWKLREWTYITEYPAELQTEECEETLTLLPMGATLLRITDFPRYK